VKEVKHEYNNNNYVNMDISNSKRNKEISYV